MAIPHAFGCVPYTTNHAYARRALLGTSPSVVHAPSHFRPGATPKRLNPTAEVQMPRRRLGVTILFRTISLPLAIGSDAFDFNMSSSPSCATTIRLLVQLNHQPHRF